MPGPKTEAQHLLNQAQYLRDLLAIRVRGVNEQLKDCSRLSAEQAVWYNAEAQTLEDVLDLIRELFPNTRPPGTGTS